VDQVFLSQLAVAVLVLDQEQTTLVQPEITLFSVLLQVLVVVVAVSSQLMV
jgi:hypothetical protein